MLICGAFVFLGIVLIVHVSLKHWLSIHLGLPTLTCFIIDYHVKGPVMVVLIGLLFLAIKLTNMKLMSYLYSLNLHVPDIPVYPLSI